MSVNDVLAKTLADSLNKKFKDTNKVAYFLDGSDTTPTDIKEFISTGSSTLDLAIWCTHLSRNSKERRSSSLY